MAYWAFAFMMQALKLVITNFFDKQLIFYQIIKYLQKGGIALCHKPYYGQQAVRALRF